MGKTSRTKRRFNVIDVLIIMLVLALLATVGYRVYAQITENVEGEKSDFVIEFKLSENDEEYRSMMNAIKNGDKVYFCSDGILMGYIYDKKNDGKDVIYELDQKNEGEADTGLYNKVSFGGMIALSAQADEVKGSDYLVIGDRNLSVGSRIEVYTEKAIFTITVTSIGKLK